MIKRLTDSELLDLTKLFFGYIPKTLETKEINRIFGFATKYGGNKNRFIYEKLFLHARIDQTRGCWIKIKGDYYMPIIIGKNNLMGHRLSYMLMKSDWDPTLYVCHFCDIKPCINPFHLFLGTASDNFKDYWIRKKKQFATYTWLEK